MTELESALVEVASLLEEIGLPYMLIGGLAVALWGEPRATLDVDVSVWVEPQHFDEAVQTIAGRFRTLPDALEFARRTRVLPVVTAQGIRADIVFSALDEERRMMERARVKRVGTVDVRVASVEDLIWMKLMSERPKDQQDARQLIHHFRATLDRKYLDPKLEELAEAFARTDIIDIYKDEMGRE
jgi:hypothetical protein